MAEDRGRLIRAIAKRAEYLANEDAAGDEAGVQTQAVAIIGFAARLVDVPDEAVSEDGLFTVAADDATVYLVGARPGNPDGVTFTLGDARRWWEVVFADGLNISHVRPTLLPGVQVLSETGWRAAVELARTSTTYAPREYNPLGLEVVA